MMTNDNHTIKVTGRGTVHVTPDVTRLEVNITGVFKTYAAAYAQARENSMWLVKVLEYNKLSGKQAKTLCLDISDHQQQVYDDFGNYKETIKNGFDLEQRIKIDLGIDNVLLNKVVRGIGKFIKGAQIAIGYTVKDASKPQLLMLERAVTDSKGKAQIMAIAAQCALGEVITIEYGDWNMHVYSQARNIHSSQEAMACSTDSLEITPDDLAVSDTVEVTWQLLPNKQ